MYHHNILLSLQWSTMRAADVAVLKGQLPVQILGQKSFTVRQRELKTLTRSHSSGTQLPATPHARRDVSKTPGWCTYVLPYVTSGGQSNPSVLVLLTLYVCPLSHHVVIKHATRVAGSTQVVIAAATGKAVIHFAQKVCANDDNEEGKSSFGGISLSLR